jgi:hypothetical protein
MWSNEAYRDERIKAIAHFEDAFTDAELQGVSSDAMAQAALFASLLEMVSLYGEDATADFCDTLKSRVLSGEFSISRTLQ